MSVPIHNLYDFVHMVTKKQYMLMYYLPFGSRDLHDIHNHQQSMEHLTGPMGIDVKDILISKFLSPDQISLGCVHKTQPVIFCHDQEPLNFDFYLDDSKYVTEFRHTCTINGELNNENFY